MPSNFYETGKALSEYLLFHYGKPAIPAIDFPVQCVSECLDPGRLPKSARALDLGCAVGRSAFELARYCREVVAVDNSEAFIEAATRLRDGGSLEFEHAWEGDLTAREIARAPARVNRRRVRFEVGDAMKLRAELGRFDVVLLANLIDRLPDPRRCLAQLPSLVKADGQLIIASPYTWLETYTPRAKWLGGFARRGRPVLASRTLRDILLPDFKLVKWRNLPFLIWEHARKAQLGVSEATVWIRR